MIQEQVTPEQHETMQAAVDWWNRDNPVGTPVDFWPGFREGPGRRTVTRSVAWVMPSGSAVVMVEGYAGAIALTHVDVRKADHE